MPQSDTIDREEAIRFMTMVMEEQFTAMMKEMPPEVTGSATIEMLELQKGPVMEGITQVVDEMSVECPFPWSHNQAMRILMGHAMVKLSAAKGAETAPASVAASPPKSKKVSISVPQGAVGGQQMTVTVQGLTFRVTVPGDAKPGDKFQVDMPTADELARQKAEKKKKKAADKATKAAAAETEETVREMITVTLLNQTESNIWFRVSYGREWKPIEGIVAGPGLTLSVPLGSQSISWREWHSSQPGEDADFVGAQRYA